MITGPGAVAAASVGKLVTEFEPLSLDERLETFDGAVMGIEEKLGQRRDLRRPVPAVGTVDEDGATLGLDGRHHHHGRFDDGTHAL